MCGMGTSCISASMFERCVACLLLYPTVVAAQPQAVVRAMDAQEEAWNRGDVAEFMAQGYAPRTDLIFVGSNGLTEGYAETLARYRSAYPDRSAMGQLTFGFLRWQRLGMRHGIYVGTWKLSRAEGDVAGHFSLVWKRTLRGWRIVADHSS